MTRAARQFAAATLVLLAACSTPEPALTPSPTLAWPGDPEPTRVVYVGAFSRAEDLGIRKSFLQRLGDLLFGAKDSHIIRPSAVLDADGVIYVADPGARGVHRFDRTRGRYDLIRRAGGAALLSPVALARGADDEVYVSDSALAQVFVMRRGDAVAEPLALRHTLAQPTGLAFDPASRRLHVVDTTAHRILVFDARGELTAAIGERGTAAGQFNFPTLLWRDPDGRLFVTDALNFRVQILDPQGRFTGQFGRHGDAGGDLVRHKGVATDRFGHVYVVDGLLHALQIFDESGRYLLGIGGLGREAGEFWLPMGIFVGIDDMIFVADSHNRRVQMFRYVGGPK